MSDHTHDQWRSTITNVTEETVVEEYQALSYKESFTTGVLQQVYKAAATSCFRVYCSYQSCYGWIYVKTRPILIQKQQIELQNGLIQLQMGWIQLQRRWTLLQMGRSQLQRCDNFICKTCRNHSKIYLKMEQLTVLLLERNQDNGHGVMTKTPTMCNMCIIDLKFAFTFLPDKLLMGMNWNLECMHISQSLAEIGLITTKSSCKTNYM